MSDPAKATLEPSFCVRPIPGISPATRWAVMACEQGCRRSSDRSIRIARSRSQHRMCTRTSRYKPRAHRAQGSYRRPRNLGASATCQDLGTAEEPPTEHSLIIKVLPGVSAVEGPDTNIRDVRCFHHPGVYGDAVVTVLVSAFIMRQTPTTFAVKEFE